MENTVKNTVKHTQKKNTQTCRISQFVIDSFRKMGTPFTQLQITKNEQVRLHPLFYVKVNESYDKGESQ